MAPRGRAKRTELLVLEEHLQALTHAMSMTLSRRERTSCAARAARTPPTSSCRY